MMGRSPASTSPVVSSEFSAVHERLMEVLKPFRARLIATMDSPSGMKLEIPGLEGKPWGYVAGTRVGKRYVSFYLMSVYAFPDLAESLSPRLRARMQGKSCFNFAVVDEELFTELQQVVEAGFDRYLQLAREVAATK